MLPLAAAAKPAPGPALTTSTGKLAKAFKCTGKLSGATRDPVLLVHGTFADSEINWSWNYVRALPKRHETACTVDLPDVAAGDAQISTEYVVFAIRRMAERSDRHVAIIAHSQGGLEARWALRWWPDIRHLVSDVITFGTPNHGAVFTDNNCGTPGSCAASMYQMRSDSNFLAALNHGGEAIGSLPYTVIGSTSDHVFVEAEAGRLHSSSRHVRNVTVQDLCPGRVVDHNGLVYDAVSYALAVDALDHPGPARPGRIGGAVCAQQTMPATTPEEANMKVASYTGTLLQLLGPTGPKAQGEPALKRYARAG
jgi:triacylglycerol esterase/lipase EstA (alpha/beta hydrolase family)